MEPLEVCVPRTHSVEAWQGTLQESVSKMVRRTRKGVCGYACICVFTCVFCVDAWVGVGVCVRGWADTWPESRRRMDAPPVSDRASQIGLPTSRTCQYPRLQVMRAF